MTTPKQAVESLDGTVLSGCSLDPELRIHKALMIRPNHDWSLRSQQIKASHRGVGSKRPWHWSRQNVQEKGVPGRPLPDYQQHLYRLLGPEKASHILNPPILEKPISAPVQRLLVAGRAIGAKELWRALHEEPKCQRQLAEAKKGRSLSHQVPWLGCPVSTPRMLQVACWRRQLHTMHRLGKQRQRTASCLLATKHITDLSDPYGTEGPARYLHYTPDNKQVLGHMLKD
ncbi:uncharacterized protein LOC132571999 [Heteronotia binoei]|uniref:uncharacterized protein LOC132571999 n=1 Tax=Heteronotia binoei TaxID=13085 RepID=UPI002931D7D8|nr:uncharacterized protein LOC132571999 [Heteronotia binoei]